MKDLATEAFLNVYRWTKVVLVEKSAYPTSFSGTASIADPKVYIERKKYQMSKVKIFKHNHEHMFYISIIICICFV